MINILFTNYYPLLIVISVEAPAINSRIKRVRIHSWGFTKKIWAFNPPSHHALDDERLRSPNPQHDRVSPVIKVQEALPYIPLLAVFLFEQPFFLLDHFFVIPALADAIFLGDCDELVILLRGDFIMNDGAGFPFLLAGQASLGQLL